MSAPHDIAHAIHALRRDFLRHHPMEALRVIAGMPAGEIGELIGAQPEAQMIGIWEQLPAPLAGEVLERLDGKQAALLLTHADAVKAARALAGLPEAQRARILPGLGRARARELEALMRYPEGSAGALMTADFTALPAETTARAALHRLRARRGRAVEQIYLIEEAMPGLRRVALQDLALADPRTPLGELARPVAAAVLPTSGLEEIVEQFDRHKLTSLPVVDINGNLVGIIRHDALVEAVREETSADILTMVGASKEERALSRVAFVVRKRLPWLQINLLTAFLAASVVGLFEATIAKFTALAVLLPVVAGQSGNTGAQALAVTMRALALREISVSHWPKVARKELVAGFINGVAVALVTALGVLLWSGSYGLAIVIGCAMVISMAAAGLAGVLIPIVLSAAGQDPAQSSSIILTTITDIVGFFTFLGIATAFSGLL